MSQEFKRDHDTAPNLYVEANGIRYAYRRFSRDIGVPLVLLQHFRGTMDDWDPSVTDGLAENRSIIVFDNAGVGLSGGKTPGCVADMALSAVEFIEALGVNEVDLLGFSLGGFVAQQILLDHPGLVRRAILAGTGPQGGDGMQGYTPEVTALATRYPQDGTEKDFLFFAPSKTSQAAAKAFTARTQKRKTGRDIATTLQTMQAQGEAISAWGMASNEAYTARLELTNRPVLVVNGSKDIMVPTINAFALAQRIPQAQLIIYPDAGHGALFQYPNLFVAHATLFLA